MSEPEKGNAETIPRVTLEDIESEILSTEYVVHGTCTIAFVKLLNGFVVTGESHCVNPANYNKEQGEKYAREDAIKKLWAPFGFRLKDRLYHAEQTLSGSAVRPNLLVETIKVEEEDLADRITNLQAFIGAESAQHLNVAELQDLYDQLQYMRGYYTIVQRRLQKLQS